MEWLGLEGKGLRVRDRGEAIEIVGSGSAGAAPPEEGTEVLAAVGGSAEEDFHEPEGWPAAEGALPELLAAESVSSLSI